MNRPSWLQVSWPLLLGGLTGLLVDLESSCLILWLLSCLCYPDFLVLYPVAQVDFYINPARSASCCTLPPGEWLPETIVHKGRLLILLSFGHRFTRGLMVHYLAPLGFGSLKTNVLPTAKERD